MHGTASKANWPDWLSRENPGSSTHSDLKKVSSILGPLFYACEIA